MIFGMTTQQTGRQSRKAFGSPRLIPWGGAETNAHPVRATGAMRGLSRRLDCRQFQSVADLVCGKLAGEERTSMSSALIPQNRAATKALRREMPANASGPATGMSPPRLPGVSPDCR